MPRVGVEKRNIVRVGPPLTNLSGSAHAEMYVLYCEQRRLVKHGNLVFSLNDSLLVSIYNKKQHITSLSI